MKRIYAILTALVLALTTLVAVNHQPADAYLQRSWTNCYQSGTMSGVGNNNLGRRVCFDKSEGRLYMFDSDVDGAGPSAFYSSATAGTYTAFQSTAAEFAPEGSYSAQVTGVIWGNSTIYFTSSPSTAPNYIVTSSNGQAAARYRAGLAAYEFVWVP